MTTMKIINLDQYESSLEQEFADVTAKIQPLPENVVPSDRFLQQMRRRLLALQVKPDSSPEKAA